MQSQVTLILSQIINCLRLMLCCICIWNQLFSCCPSSFTLFRYLKGSLILNVYLHSVPSPLILFMSSLPYRPVKDHQLESELHQASHTGRQLAGPQSWNQRKVLLRHIWACHTRKLLLLWPCLRVRPHRWHQGWYRRNGEWWGYNTDF